MDTLWLFFCYSLQIRGIHIDCEKCLLYFIKRENYGLHRDRRSPIMEASKFPRGDKKA